MMERLKDYYPCPGCPFHDFSQVHQCEPKGGTCVWLLTMYDKAEKWDKIITSGEEIISCGSEG